jgi:Predicted AAA-ATPase
MAKKFNITGLCLPDKHYMANVSNKLEKVCEMIDNGDYFIINRPRQYGKTTTFYTLETQLEKTGDYLVFNISFEGIGDIIFQDEKMFCAGFVKLLSDDAPPRLKKWFLEQAAQINNLSDLSDTITLIAEKTKKRAIVFIDEVDKSSNNQLFISFLAMLRNKYLSRSKKKTFHSVVLAGLHDVKSLKLKMRPDEAQTYNSPWNIAAEFKVDMNLQPFEIKPMLDDYVAEKGVKMDTAAMAEDLFYYTSGYPFLVSKLCKMMDEDALPTKENKELMEQDLEWAVKELVLEANTNFDSLIKNLENNPNLYKIVHNLLIEGGYNEYNVYDPIINLGLMHGILRNGRGVKIHNKIYEELIYRYMTSKTKTELGSALAHNTIGQNFKLANNALNLEMALMKFQLYMHENHSKHDRDFLEHNGRLVFLAFMRPILNGHGYDFKEVEISEERRLDVTITFYQHKYVAELKIWRGQAAHEKGLEQLNDYLNRLHLTEGYLVVFGHKEVKTWHSEWIEYSGKKIFIVWV